MKKENSFIKNYSRIGFILAIFAVLFLIANSIYLEVNKDRLISDLRLNPNISLQTIHQVPLMIDFIVILWFAISAIILFSLFFLKNTKCLPVIILFLSIICLLTMRIDSFILGVLSSIFFFKSTKSKAY